MPHIAMTNADTRFVTLPELGARLRDGRLTPTVLTEQVLERLGQEGPRYNALVTLLPDRARAEARQAEAELAQGIDRGPLHGIPYGIKDMLATAEGSPTSWGFAGVREQHFDLDAAVVERLRAAGAVLCGKLAMVELAGGMKTTQANNSFTGAARNPWNPTAWTGGSSAGSAAAVSAGLMPFALGSESLASIVNPSAYCGVTGIRPSMGRVPRHGAMALAWTLDKLGPIGKTAHDCGLVLEHLAGPDRRDPAAFPARFRLQTGSALPGEGRRLRLLVPEGARDSPQPEVRARFDAACDLLRNVADLEERPLPKLPYQDAAYLIYYSEAAAAFQHTLAEGRHAQLSAPEGRPWPAALATLPARDYINALRLRQKMAREFSSLMAGYDAALSPTLMMVAPPLDRPFAEYMGSSRRAELTTIGNFLGLPGVTVPSGLGERGLPTGLLFTGTWRRENSLLALANWFQHHSDWHQQHPSPVAKAFND